MGGIGTPVAILIGVMLLVVGIGLFFLDTFKPGYRRDSDKVYGILFMTLGILSLANWQAGFGVSLLLMVSAGTLIALIVERIRSRSAGNEPLQQMGGRSNRRESERPSRPYRTGFEENLRSEVRAEFDDDPIPMEEPSRVRRIRGGREGGSGGSRDAYQNAYLDQLSEDTREPRRTTGRRSSNAYDDEPPYREDPRSRRSPLQLEGDAAAALGSNSYGEDRSDRIESPSVRGRRRSRANGASSSESEPSSSRSSRRRASRANGDRLDGDYVDYKPLGNPKPPSNDDDFDNSGNFDDSPNFR